MDGMKTSYIWGHYNTCILSKITGSDISSAQALVSPSILINPASETQLATELDKLRSLTNAFITTFIYDANTGLSLKKIKDPNNRSTYYEYDNLGRLLIIKDNNLNLIKINEYKYQQHYTYPYKNTAQFRIIHPTNVTCAPGYTFNDVGYNVPADKYGSFISVDDANAKADLEIYNYGLAYANANVVCYPYYAFTPCCLWGSAYSNFNLSGSTSVDFSVIVFKQSGTTNWTIDNQVANLVGSLFLPSVQRVVTITSAGRTWNVTFKPTGQVSILLSVELRPQPQHQFSWQALTIYNKIMQTQLSFSKSFFHLLWLTSVAMTTFSFIHKGTAVTSAAFSTIELKQTVYLLRIMK